MMLDEDEMEGTCSDRVRNNDNEKSKKRKSKGRTEETSGDGGGGDGEEDNVAKSRYVGTAYTIGDTHFLDKRGLYMTRFEDYEILSTEDFTEFSRFAPRSLKRALSPRWRYAIHVSYGVQPSVTRDLLYTRVIGGQILAYKYLECSIEGNESVYYGFIPTLDNYTIRENTHSRCRFRVQAVYPRLLYVHLARCTPCNCSEDCWYWKATLHEGLSSHAFCGRNIPWSRLYVMMGELDRECSETVDAKDARECPVCAQCFDCSMGARYCRTHRICKHKQAVGGTIGADDGTVDLASVQLRQCKKLKK